jgi:predicted RNA binding protein YcfA (HicA-like mRNA interferase family)
MNSFTPELKKLLEKAGCYFVRQGRGDHEIWESPISGIRFTVASAVLDAAESILTNDVFGDPSIRRRRTTAPK